MDRVDRAPVGLSDPGRDRDLFDILYQVFVLWLMERGGSFVKRYYCDVCDKPVPNMVDRNKIKITECWDNSTYKKLICDDCLKKVIKVLRGETDE